MENKLSKIIIALSIIFLFSSYSFNPLAKKHSAKSFKSNYPGELDTLGILVKSISQRDPYNYLVVALYDWVKTGRGQINYLKTNGTTISAMPIMLMIDSVLVRPDNSKYTEITKSYFNDPNRFFSIDFGGKCSGIVQINSKYRWDGVNLKLIYFDNNLLRGSRESHQNYSTIASTLFPGAKNQVKRKYGTEIEKEEAKKVAIDRLKYNGVNIKETDSIELIDLQFIEPEGKNSLYTFSVSRYYEVKGKIKETHYLSLLYKNNNSHLKPLFERHTHWGENEELGYSSYWFLDLIDYDFDGKDELLIVKSGYEHQDVILYKIEDDKIVEIYRIATNIT